MELCNMNLGAWSDHYFGECAQLEVLPTPARPGPAAPSLGSLPWVRELGSPELGTVKVYCSNATLDADALFMHNQLPEDHLVRDHPVLGHMSNVCAHAVGLSRDWRWGKLQYGCAAWAIKWAAAD